MTLFFFHILFQALNAGAVNEIKCQNGGRVHCDGHELKSAEIQQCVLFKDLVLHALQCGVIVKKGHLGTPDIVGLAETGLVEHGKGFPYGGHRDLVFLSQCRLRWKKGTVLVIACPDLIDQIAGNLHIVMVPSLFRAPGVVIGIIHYGNRHVGGQVIQILSDRACDGTIHTGKTAMDLPWMFSVHSIHHPHGIFVILISGRKELRLGAVQEKRYPSTDFKACENIPEQQVIRCVQQAVEGNG